MAQNTGHWCLCPPQ